MKQIVYLNNDGKGFSFDTSATTRFMSLSAQPLNEELATYGPFVMDTQAKVCMH